ncbi:MAG TPA: hypothetical protein DCZ01_10425 [Elusimicrobia bacterium]|nr:hypothetical protein [Elusimicrobiota bacterium]
MVSDYSCGWDLVHVCNYRCPYCFFLPSWAVNEAEMSRRHLSCSREDWLDFWRRCFDQLGSFRIEIAGGEPFSHPDLLPLVREISRRHTIRLVTNLSVDVREILTELDPARVAFSVSFHPSQARFEKLLEKLRLLKQAKFEVVVSIVAYPPYLRGLEGWMAVLEREGLRCFLNPFQGSFEDREYPLSYTVEDSLVLRQNTFPEEPEIRMRQASPRGLLCAAGSSYFRIWPDGAIHRCCAATELGLRPLGHIHDRIIPVSPEAAACPADRCFAPNEVSCLIKR